MALGFKFEIPFFCRKSYICLAISSIVGISNTFLALVFFLGTSTGKSIRSVDFGALVLPASLETGIISVLFLI